MIYDYARRQIVDAGALHSALVSGYAEQCNGRWHAGPNDGYFLGHLPQHLKGAGLNEQLSSLMGDSRWLSRQLESSLGVTGLGRVLFCTEEPPTREVPSFFRVLLEGPPGSGKTRFALQLLVRMAASGSRCAFFTADLASAAWLLQQTRYMAKNTRGDESAEAPNSQTLSNIRIAPASDLFAANALQQRLAHLIPPTFAAVFIEGVPAAIDRRNAYALLEHFAKTFTIGLVETELVHSTDGTVLENIADVVIRFSIDPRAFPAVRTLKILKSRRLNSSWGPHRFRLENIGMSQRDSGVSVLVLPDDRA